MPKYVAREDRKVDVEFLNRDTPFMGWERRAQELLGLYARDEKGNTINLIDGDIYNLLKFNTTIHELWEEPDFQKAYKNAYATKDYYDESFVAEEPGVIDFRQIMGPYLFNRHVSIKEKNQNAEIKPIVIPEKSDPVTQYLSEEDAKRIKATHAEDLAERIIDGWSKEKGEYSRQALLRIMKDEQVQKDFRSLMGRFPYHRGEIAEIANSENVDEMRAKFSAFAKCDTLPDGVKDQLGAVVDGIMANHANAMKPEHVKQNYEEYMDAYLNKIVGEIDDTLVRRREKQLEEKAAREEQRKREEESRRQAAVEAEMAHADEVKKANAPKPEVKAKEENAPKSEINDAVEVKEAKDPKPEINNVVEVKEAKAPKHEFVTPGEVKEENAPKPEINNPIEVREERAPQPQINNQGEERGEKLFDDFVVIDKPEEQPRKKIFDDFLVVEKVQPKKNAFVGRIVNDFVVVDREEEPKKNAEVQKMSFKDLQGQKGFKLDIKKHIDPKKNKAKEAIQEAKNHKGVNEVNAKK